MPRRIQLKRTKGWRKPPGAVVVARPGKWGNPYRVARDPQYPDRWAVLDVVNGEIESLPMREQAVAVLWAVQLYRWWMQDRLASAQGQALRDVIDAELRGRDLACWCPLDQPSHADVLLEVANR